MDKENQFWTRRLQTLPVNHAAMLCIASPIVKALKLSSRDTMIEQVDEQGRIIITKAHLPVSDRQSEDGVFH